MAANSGEGRVASGHKREDQDGGCQVRRGLPTDGGVQHYALQLVL